MRKWYEFNIGIQKEGNDLLGLAPEIDISKALIDLDTVIAFYCIKKIDDHEKTVLELTNGQNFRVMETYDNVKMILSEANLLY